MSAFRWVEAGLLSALVCLAARAASVMYLLGPYYLERAQLWRVPGDRFVAWIGVVYVLFGLVLAYVYIRVRSVLGSTARRRGVQFGLWIWLISSIPYQGIRFVLMPIPWQLAVGDTVRDLIALVLSGLIFSWLLEPKSR